MRSDPIDKYKTGLRLDMSEFWSGDLGLTLVTISVTILIFVITPLRDAGLRGRIFFNVVVEVLMIYGAIVANPSRIFRVFVIATVLATSLVLAAGRLHPTPFLHLFGSVLATITLLLYVRIVLLVMFRAGPVTWSRIQGGVCAYLLLGMAWASGFQFLEQLRPGSFRFVSAPADLDQLTAKLTYLSFATLTTIGSDITPVNPFARSLTTAEAVVGQLFPAILIGALVAMAMQPRPNSAPGQ
ncbi:MAG TPA: ion channel [Candidatus Sulfotelmatobacter sp.]|nr:ion channel [Candidatus Sulfotelmatobacter sp.]